MKKTLSIIFAALLTVGLAGCGAKKDANLANTEASKDKKTIKVGATTEDSKEFIKIVSGLKLIWQL
jgi:ABC-type metal ion transport system substrate-binding protein